MICLKFVRHDFSYHVYLDYEFPTFLTGFVNSDIHQLVKFQEENKDLFNLIS